MTAENVAARASWSQWLVAGLMRFRLFRPGGVHLGRNFALALTIAAVASSVGTFLAVSGGFSPTGPGVRTVLLLLIGNLVLLLALGVVVASRLVQVWVERRRGLAGSRLHIRLVVLFGLIAIAPTIIVAIFSYLFLSVGLDGWFSERVKTAIAESRVVAQAYYDEHQQIIRGDALAMASDLSRESYLLLSDPERFSGIVNAQASIRSLNEAVVFDGQGHVLARSLLSFGLEFEPLPQWALAEAQEGGIAIFRNGEDDRVRALVRLSSADGAYLYVGRFIEPRVLQHVEQTNAAVEQYERLEGSRSRFQITFALSFLVVALLLLMAAVWFGLNFATQLVRPISGLVIAAEHVRSGDLSARVPEAKSDDEFATLSRAFNRMTRQLQTQQSELIEANRQLDVRRRFTETVLSGVSAGVVGLDHSGRINLPNKSASGLLGVDLEQRLGEKLTDIVPAIAELLAEAVRRPDRLAQAELRVDTGKRSRTLLARIAAEPGQREERGFVLTFDDITELQSAQRKAAWADVARRIAHEIKNPLTPIQLSAERLKRKYLKEISSDPDTFAMCTDTIIRQVGDIGRMVDEFSSFARMPAPVLQTHNLLDLCRQALFLQKSAHPDIRITGDLPDHAVPLPCDARQIGQALTNLLQNAADSIEGRSVPAPEGAIVLRLEEGPGQVRLVVEDNGKGLPQAERERLTEPYVTTRAKGTGLGLAIVKKIMEDHGGSLDLNDRAGGGAAVSLVFPRDDAAGSPVGGGTTDTGRAGLGSPASRSDALKTAAYGA